jgi:hypothetical protein
MVLQLMGDRTPLGRVAFDVLGWVVTDWGPQT